MEMLETKNMIQVKQVADTMALEDMYLDKDFIKQLLKVASGELSSEELRQEVISQYAR
ncbi:MAG: antitoxin VbhA family protein [Lachnospiraceae bacterium]|nr:antitoxin VbhA family protein [Lachnospiraceae bacterium]